MRSYHTLGLLAGLAMSSLASAATHSLSLTADPTSRWYEYSSAAYGELGREWNGSQVLDGFFSTETGAPFGRGADIFPYENDFANIGTLSFSDVSGIGVQTASITGLTMDFSRYVADDDSITNRGYTTALSNIVGSVSLYNGAVTDITLQSTITFTYAAIHPVTGATLGSLPYVGTFSIQNGEFVLDVDQTVVLFGARRYAWDVTGSVAGLAIAPAVPEPSTYAMLAAGLVLIGAATRRRQSTSNN